MLLRRLLFSRVFHVIGLLLSAGLAYEGLRELFWADPPRLLQPDADSSRPTLQFTLDTQTVTHLIMAVGGLLYWLASAWYIQRQRTGQSVSIRDKLFQVAALVSALLAYVVAAMDFLSHAGAFG